MENKFSILYSDHPWNFRKQKHQENKYKQLSIKEICSYTIPATDNATLFLWSTFSKIHHQITIMQSWGFVYSGFYCIWIKKNKHKDTPFVGVGSYTASNCEVLLIGFKGPQKEFQKHIVFETVLGNNKKPDSIKTLIVHNYPRLVDRAELFFESESTRCWEKIDVSRGQEPSRKRKRLRSVSFTEQITPTSRYKFNIFVTTAELKDIRRLNLLNHSEDNCVFVFSAANEELNKHIEAVESLGFFYKTLFTCIWDKDAEETSLFYVAMKKGGNISHIKQKHRSQIQFKTKQLLIDNVMDVVQDVFADLPCCVISNEKPTKQVAHYVHLM